MPVFNLNESLNFPSVDLAEPDGLLAVGGDLSVERLLQAYQSGIFPWYNEPPILWWHPNPRFVLFPQNLKIGKSLKPLLKRNVFDFTINQAFCEVITNCKNMERREGPGSWINKDIIDAYCALHQLGYAHSAEVWQDGKLVGGLYGVRLGKVFFGESMFSLVSNASKYAFAKYVQQLLAEDVQLIDCQVYTAYLESLGAQMIDGTRFQQLLKQFIKL